MKIKTLLTVYLVAVVAVMMGAMDFRFFDASQITTGTISAARLPGVSSLTGQLTNGQLPDSISTTGSVTVGTTSLHTGLATFSAGITETGAVTLNGNVTSAGSNTWSGVQTFNGSMAINGGQSNASGQNALFNGPTTVDSFNETNAQLRFRNGYALDASGGTGIAGRDHSGANQDGVAVYGHDGFSIWTTQTSAVLVNASGNMTLDPRGASETLPVDLASTTKKLYVNGAAHVAGVLSAQLTAMIGTLVARSDIWTESAWLDIGSDNSGINGIAIHNSGDSAEVAFVKQHTGLIVAVAGDLTATDNKISIRTEDTASSFTPTERILIGSGGAVTYTPADAGTTSVSLNPGALDADATIEIEVSDGTGPASATGSLAGAAVNDVVLLGPPADLEPSLAYRARVSTTGVVKIIFQNMGTSTVFAAKTWKIKLVH